LFAAAEALLLPSRAEFIGNDDMQSAAELHGHPGTRDGIFPDRLAMYL